MSLYELRTTVHEKEQFIYQGLWYNNNIKINNSAMIYIIRYDKRITFIYDLLNQYGAWLSYQDFTCYYILWYQTMYIERMVNTEILQISSSLKIITKNKEYITNIYDIFMSKSSPHRQMVCWFEFGQGWIWY